jgi:hypothetical protein
MFISLELGFFFPSTYGWVRLMSLELTSRLMPKLAYTSLMTLLGSRVSRYMPQMTLLRPMQVCGKGKQASFFRGMYLLTLG